jgi:hypothetical protein
MEPRYDETQGNIADFAAHVTPGCSFEFMPVEGRVYFMRKADAGPDRGWSADDIDW